MKKFMVWQSGESHRDAREIAAHGEIDAIHRAFDEDIDHLEYNRKYHYLAREIHSDAVVEIEILRRITTEVCVRRLLSLADLESQETEE